MAKIVMACSGGLDSSVLMAKLVKEGHELTAVNFQYGSRHNPHEREAARLVCQHYGVQIFSMDIAGVMTSYKSSLLAGQEDLPEGHYEEESMRKTVVPGRNLIFIAALAGLAESIGAAHVALGVHAGDHHIYPDCRPDFIEAAAKAVELSSDGKVGIMAPFTHINKTHIVRVGQKYDVPFKLTRTCYSSDEIACGKCGSCQERLEAFFRAGIPDPIEYASRELLPKRT